MSSHRGGSKPGERRGGRKAGVPNKVNRDLKELAQAYTPEALNTLAEIMRSDEQSGAARVAAASAILDRGHGKPGQHIAVDQNVTLTDDREAINDIANIFGISATAGAADEPSRGRPVVRPQTH